MNRVETQAVVKTWKELVRSVDVRNVIDVLVQEQIVSLEEHEYIIKGQTRCEQSRRMLLKVIDCSDPATYSIFLQALHENYPFIVEEINRKLTSLKRKRFQNSKQKHAVEVEHDLNITELKQRLPQPVEYGCSVCSVDAGCNCNVSGTDNTCTTENCATSSHPPIEHAHSWASPTGSFEAEHTHVRSRRGSFPPKALLDSVTGIFGSFDISRYERMSMIPPELLQQLADSDCSSSDSDPIETLRQLSMKSGGSPPLRYPQENGITPDGSFSASVDTQFDYVPADDSSTIQVPNGTEPETVLNTCDETHVKQVISNGASVNGLSALPNSVISPGRTQEPTESTEEERDDTEVKQVISNGTNVNQPPAPPNSSMLPGRKREPTEGTDEDRDETDLKQVVPNGVCGKGDTPEGAPGGMAQVDRPVANGVSSRESTRFFDLPGSQRRAPTQPSQTNGTNGTTSRVHHTCRRHVLITPRVVKKNTDYGFRLGSATSTGGFGVESVTNGGPAANRLLQSDVIFSINSEEVQGWTKKKANKKIESTHRQLVLEVESMGEILEHQIVLALPRSRPDESWGFSMIHGSLRPRYTGDTEFYCTDIDPDSPVGRSSGLRVGDVITGCKHFSFVGKTKEEVNAEIGNMQILSLHIARKEFRQQGDPRYGHSSC